MTLDPTKPVQQRNGRKARIICTDAVGPYPIVVLLKGSDGVEVVQSYTAEGYYLKSGGVGANDLINTPPQPREIWVNEYESGISFRHHARKKDADKAAGPDLVRTVKFREVIE